MARNEIDVQIKIGGEWKALASLVVEQDRRALHVINRLRDMLIDGAALDHQRVSEFMEATEREYADVFEAADAERERGGSDE